MKYLKFLPLALLAMGNFSFAQKIKLINSGEIIKNAMALHDSSKYKDAIGLLDQVSRSDTNYVWSVYEKAMSCEADSQFTRAIALCREGLALKEAREYEPDLYNIYGNTLDDIGQPENAINVFNTAIAKYPAYSLLYFNKGVALTALKRYSDAEALFKQALLINPYMYSAHYQLGIIALKQGKIVPAMMSFIGYLMVNPEGRYWSAAIKQLDAIAKATDDITAAKNSRTIPPDQNYREMEEILLSKIALDPSYKPLISIDDPISRQIQALFEKLTYNKDSKDFWIQYYLPIFKQAYESGKFEPFIFWCFSNVNIPVIQDYNKKNKKEVQAFTDAAAAYFNKIRETRELNYSSRDTMTNKYLFDDGKLVGKGLVSPDGKSAIGYWTFFYPAGNLRSKGAYNAQGQQDGDWTYYFNNGQLKAREHAKAGKLEGPQEYFFDNGNPSSKENYLNGQMDGLNTGYYYGGNVKSTGYYKLGKKDGEEKQYYSNGSLQLVSQYTAGIQTGTATEYYKNGKVKSTTQYADGKDDGPYKSYEDNGVLSVEGNFVKGKAEGVFKYYYKSGKLKETRNYVNDLEDGDHLEYYENGKVSEKYQNKKGKITGDVLRFYSDGKPFSHFVYDNGIIKSGNYSDRSGKNLFSAAAKADQIRIVNYDTLGYKQSSAIYNNKGNFEGADTTFYPSGKISGIDTYKDGTLNGPSVSYFFNGKKKTEANLTNGKQDGYYISYYNNGQVEAEGWMQNGETQGEWDYYDGQGRLAGKSYYLNGELDGYKETYTPDGKKTIEERYHNGWLQQVTQFDDAGNIMHIDSFPRCSGKYTLLYPDKKVMTEVNYVNGDFDGPYKTYFFDGSPETTLNYKKGIIDGDYTDYYYGGKKSTEGRFVNGNKTGEWKTYDDDGKLYSTLNYADDRLNGIKTFYFKNGAKDFEGNYKDDEAEGSSKKYDPDGTLAYVVNFSSGYARSYSYLGADGKPVPEIPISDANGKVHGMFPNGKPSREATYYFGIKNGEEKVYYSNGTLRSVDTVTYDVTNGVGYEYYPDGKLKSKYNYVNDNADAVCQEYNPNGTLKKEITFDHGTYNGPTKYYDENGKLVKTMVYRYGKLTAVKNE
ncbi:MAG TPA: tetratricopeptide repeat protein [Mucilaginibacter sp.]|nr:tetratricopeptide repeat protein [Mucilaginibacter sp.]